LAAQDTGRRGYGMEIDPHYIDLIISRLKQTYNLSARCGVTGKAWDDIAAGH
jgi:DNA modification methylase